jgi:DNA invertase Pin-like site-specific DNA recombinase
MVTILAGLATFERHLIAVRTREGRTRARERGVKFGRPSKLTPHQEREARERLAAGEVQADVARSYNVSQSVISRLVSGRR